MNPIRFALLGLSLWAVTAAVPATAQGSFLKKKPARAQPVPRPAPAVQPPKPTRRDPAPVTVRSAPKPTPLKTVPPRSAKTKAKMATPVIIAPPIPVRPPFPDAVELASLAEVISCRRPLTNELDRVTPEIPFTNGKYRFYHLTGAVQFGTAPVTMINKFVIPGMSHPNMIATVISIDNVNGKLLAENLIPDLKRSKGLVKWKKETESGIAEGSYYDALGIANGDKSEVIGGAINPYYWGSASNTDEVRVYQKGLMIITCSQPD